jgi:hypothetical protein
VLIIHLLVGGETHYCEHTIGNKTLWVWGFDADP